MTARIALAALLVVCAFATPAQAIPLLVNGDTPAKTWQAMADKMAVPSPPSPVAIYFKKTPYEIRGCIHLALACADAAWIEIVPILRYLSRGERIAAYQMHYDLKVPIQAPILWHELGHVYDARILTTERRAEVNQLLRNKGEWDSQLFADGYAICAAGTTWKRRAAVAVWSDFETSPQLRRRSVIDPFCRWLRANPTVEKPTWGWGWRS